MDTRTQQLLDRTFNFGVEVLKFLATLPPNDMFRVAKYQLAKASTSIGSNYEEAQAAESKQDFSHKVGISLKEARESHYWLRMIYALLSDSKRDNVLNHLVDEAAELKNIFGTIRLSSRQSKL